VHFPIDLGTLIPNIPKNLMWDVAFNCRKSHFVYVVKRYAFIKQNGSKLQILK